MIIDYFFRNYSFFTSNLIIKIINFYNFLKFYFSLDNEAYIYMD